MYCGSCGTKLSPDAKFCRACGGPQAVASQPPLPPPPPPIALAPSQATIQAITAAALLALAGGAVFCCLTLFATIYQPLHYYDVSVNYGDSIQFGDVLAFISGAAAVVLGARLLFRPSNLAACGWGLLIAGLPTFVFAAVWAFSDLIDMFSRPFYFGYVYFAEFGRVTSGSHVVQVLLLAAGAMVIGAGLLALSSARRAPLSR